VRAAENHNSRIKEAKADKKCIFFNYLPGVCCFMAKCKKSILRASLTYLLTFVMLFLMVPLYTTATDIGVDGEEFTIIEDEDIPLAPFGNERSWALWNLLISLAGAVLALMMSVRIISSLGNEDEKTPSKGQKRLSKQIPVFAVPILAIIGIILFLLTQDMRLPVVMVDWLTLLHAIIFASGVVNYILAFRKEKDEEQPEPLQA